MKQSKAIIENNLENNPEFQYHLDTHFLKIAENLESHPDVAIETCKSFLESISRTIIKNFEGEDYSTEAYERWNFPDLTLRMMNYLSDYADFQDGFVDSMMDLMRFLGNYRNATGDICHGRAAPKERISTAQDAILVMQMTDAIGQYLLGIYFSLDFEETGEDSSYEAEKFIEFNQFLDEENPMEGLSYSRALFEQDLPAYMDKYDTYIALK